ncbi:hypothetical protein EJ065_2754 [Corallococcus coralloides]|uniref:Tryptophan dimethylallyltransferase n=1 Tax=Corallococcus coralloides TaxID=184914 RepID=A0A410RR18_CORCK|nr:hypothetical protein [Corallococcus coralloides]QAT84326.1 hypothetical protein EJ065_2754 [Corallococcus coralloides]
MTSHNDIQGSGEHGMETQTVARYAQSQLTGLGRALALPEARVAALGEAFHAATATWGTRGLDAPAPWSAVGEDGSPYEFSVAFGAKGAELRVLVEAQALPASARAYWDAGLELSRELQGRAGARLEHLERLADLFSPPQPTSFCALWHALRLPATGVPDARVYLNPAAKGPEHTLDVVRESLERLGLGARWEDVERMRGAHGRVPLLALDLSEEVIFKVYLSRDGLTVEDLEAWSARTFDSSAGDARALCSAMLPTPGPYGLLDIRTCFTMRGSEGGRPSRWVTSVTGGAVGPDALFRERLVRLMESQGVPVAPYLRCLEVMAPGGLGNGRGLHAGVTLQRERGVPRVTVYFSPRLYRDRAHLPEAWRAWTQAA